MANLAKEILERNSLSVLFIANFIATHLVLIFHEQYHGQSIYISYNVIFLLTLLWATHASKSVEAVSVATVLNIVLLVLDVLLFSTRFTENVFGKMLFFINLLLMRPITIILLMKNYSARSGQVDLTSGILNFNIDTTAGPSSRGYQDIEANTNNAGNA